MRRLAIGLAAALVFPASASAQLIPTPTPTPAPVAAATEPDPPGTSGALAGIDASRRSESGDQTLKPPFGALWRIDTKTPALSMIAAGGKVFITRATGAVLLAEAYDAATGKLAWSIQLASNTPPGLGYDPSYNRVIAVDDAHVRALDANTGAIAWDAPSEGSGGSTPVISGNDVYVQGRKLIGYGINTGVRGIEVDLDDSSSGEPAIAGRRIYYYAGCTLGAADLGTGQSIWHTTGCSGGGGGRAIVWRDRVFTPSQSSGRGPVSTLSGDALAGPRASAFSGDVGFALENGSLQALAFPDGAPLWKASGVRQVIGLPGSALVRFTGGRLQIRDARSGAVTWRAAIPLGDVAETGGTVEDSTVGEGLLLVAAGRHLTALAPVSRAPLVAPTLKADETDIYDGYAVDLTGSSGFGLIPDGLRAVADRYPFNGKFSPIGPVVKVDADGKFDQRLRPDRNVRLRVTAPGAGQSPTKTVYVYPKYSYRFRNVNNTIHTRLRVKVGSGLHARGRVGLYLVRPSKRSVRRLAGGTAHGNGSVAFAQLTFPALRSLGKKDYFIACLRGAAKLGMGRADTLSRRCGAATLPF